MRQLEPYDDGDFLPATYLNLPPMPSRAVLQRCDDQAWLHLTKARRLGELGKTSIDAVRNLEEHALSKASKTRLTAEQIEAIRADVGFALRYNIAGYAREY